MYRERFAEKIAEKLKKLLTNRKTGVNIKVHRVSAVDLFSKKRKQNKKIKKVVDKPSRM